MKKCCLTFCLIFLVLPIYSCTSLSPVSTLPPPQWRYEQNAIHITLKVAPQLNLNEGLPHTLLVCIYQLKDPNRFNQLAGDEEGLYKLLECSMFDASVAGYKRLIVYPGQDVSFVLDRADGAKYISLVAGYYYLQKDRIVRLYEIPVDTKRRGFLWIKKYLQPGPLHVELTLGQLQIQ